MPIYPLRNLKVETSPKGQIVILSIAQALVFPCIE